MYLTLIHVKVDATATGADGGVMYGRIVVLL